MYFLGNGHRTRKLEIEFNALKVQSKRGRNNNMSKEVDTMMGTPTDRAYLSQWELTDSRLIARKQA